MIFHVDRIYTVQLSEDEVDQLRQLVSNYCIYENNHGGCILNIATDLLNYLVGEEDEN